VRVLCVEASISDECIAGSGYREVAGIAVTREYARELAHPPRPLPQRFMDTMEALCRANAEVRAAFGAIWRDWARFDAI